MQGINGCRHHLANEAAPFPINQRYDRIPKSAAGHVPLAYLCQRNWYEAAGQGVLQDTPRKSIGSPARCLQRVPLWPDGGLPLRLRSPS